MINNYALAAKQIKQANIVLNKLLLEHKLLIFKNMKLNPKDFTKFSMQFGTPEIAHPIECQMEGYPHIRIQSNDPRYGLEYAGEYWHSDSPWNTRGAKATILLCVRSPTRAGYTLFVDMRQALTRLSPAMKAQVATIRTSYPCRQIYLRSINSLGLSVDKSKLRQLRTLHRSLIMTHPATGERALYLNEKWLKRIDGMTDEKSAALLSYLYRHCTHTSFIYTHKWEKNTILVWDNLALMHKGVKPGHGSLKLTHRITVV